MTDTNAPATPLDALETDLSELTTVDQQLTKIQGTIDEEVKAITDKYKDTVDDLTRRRTELMDRISTVFQNSRDDLLTSDSKTIVTRSGTLSASFGSEAIDITDEDAALAFTRKKGMLTKVTKVGKRTFVKNSLKKFPDFVAKCPGMILRRTEFLNIRLVKTQVEIKQDLTPYRRPLV